MGLGAALVITRPDPNLCGGVSSLWNSLAGSLGPDVRYVTIGRRVSESGSLQAAARLLRDLFRWGEALDSGIQTVILNTSLQNKALLRDALFAVRAKVSRKRVLVFVHGWDAEAYEAIASHGLLRFLLRRVFLEGATILVLAKEFRSKLLALSPRAHVEIGTIVVPDEWLSAEVNPGRRDRPLKLLYMSRIEPRKGLRETLDALYLLKQRGYEPELLVAGEGSALAELRRYGSDLGLRNVTYCGLVQGDRKRELFDSASILVLPSSYGEGLPVVVGEAMSRGLAVITTPVGGLADMFVNGKMGTLVPPGDSRSIADAIQALAAQPEELHRISAYNQQAARRLLSSDAFARQLLALAHVPDENHQVHLGAKQIEMQPRVLVATPSLSKTGGVAQYLRTLRPHLEDGVHFLTVGARSEDEWILSAGWRLVSDYWRFARALWRGPYDVVHLNPSLGARALVRDAVLLLISKAFHKQVVVFMHGWDETCERMLRRRFLPLFRRTYDRADAFIVLAARFKERLRTLGYDRSVFVEAAPVDDAILNDQDRQPSHAGRREFNILFLSRIEIAKGIYEALDTYRLVKRDFPFVSLTVAGDGSELKGAAAYAAGLGLPDVSFTGRLEGAGKRDAFKSADTFLFPSHTEGLPISVLEAMAYGLPVVTRTVGGLGDFFESGKMGFMTESYEPEDFAALLGRLIGDPALCARISSFNRTYARKHFTATQVVARLEHIYRSVYAGAH